MIKKRGEKAEKKDSDFSNFNKRFFVKPQIKVYKKLEDITLFTSTANVSGGTFF